MAATISSPWAKPTTPVNWALDSEQNEEELNRQHHLDTLKAAAPATDFPDLSAVKQTKPKKKSKQTLSLAQFSTYKPPTTTSTASVDVVLPTGPRERTAEEIAESRRGGFRNYGAGAGGDNRPPRRDAGFDGPSRADENDDWGKGKKAVSGFGGGGGSDRGERDMGPSRADGVDDWSKGKKFGSGFPDRTDRSDRREKVGFFGSSRADDVGNWGANKVFGAAPVEDRRRERRVGFEATGPGSDVDNWVKGKENDGGSGRPRLNLQPRTLPVASDNNNNINDVNVGGEEAASELVKPKANPFGAARPREEVLKEKGKDWKEIDEKLEAVSVNNNNISDVNGGGEEAPVVSTEVVKPKANPFGAARPREEVLKEKGKDWKEIDEKLEAPKMKEVEKSVEGGARRRGFGLGKSDGGDDRSVGAWRKPGSPSFAAVVASASVETTEKSAKPETSESTDEASEGN